jgi:hypothetical protein
VSGRARVELFVGEPALALPYGERVASSTKDQQVKTVVEALAAATRALGVTGVLNDKLAVEFALGRAWRDWPHGASFPSIAGIGASNLLYRGIHDSARRRLVAAGWHVDQWLTPFLTQEWWGAADTLDHVATDDLPAEAWTRLADAFIKALKPENITRD